MSVSIEYASYLIRLWREVDIGTISTRPEWQGEVEHIQSGQRWMFSSAVEVLAFLGRQAEDIGALGVEPGE